MKNIKSSIIIFISTVGFIYAGGDISPVTPYETDDMRNADLKAIEIVKTEDNKFIAIPLKRDISVSSGSEVIVSHKKNIIPPKEEVVIPPKKSMMPPKEEVVIPPKKNMIPPKEEIVIPPTKVIRNDTDIYIGIGLAIAKYDANCDCRTSDSSGVDKTGGITVKGGYNLNKYLGIEARGVSTNIKDDGAKVSHYGAYIKPMIPITEDIKTYGLIGYGKSKTSGKLRNSDVQGFSWGLGVNYDMTNRVSFFIDYQDLINKSDSNAPELNLISIGTNYNF